VTAMTAAPEHRRRQTRIQRIGRQGIRGGRVRRPGVIVRRGIGAAITGLVVAFGGVEIWHVCGTLQTQKPARPLAADRFHALLTVCGNRVGVYLVLDFVTSL
jgi:hypothetical protein